VIVNRPVPFAGTEEERQANRATHDMVAWEIGERRECMNCCARDWHTALDYPCGVKPPRETVDTCDPQYVPSVLEAIFTMIDRDG